MWPASVKYMDRASVSFATQHVEDFADCCRSSTRQHRKLSSPSQSDQMWRMLTIFHPNSQNQAHIACTLAEEGTGDDRLLRSEMICALSLMREKRRLKAYLDHLIIPIFVYTFSGRKVRVVQVHFDGRHLCRPLNEISWFRRRECRQHQTVASVDDERAIGNTRTFGSSEAFDDAKCIKNCPATLARRIPIQAVGMSWSTDST